MATVQVPYLLDTFDDPNGTNLTSHTPDCGNAGLAWAINGGASTAVTLDGAGRAILANTGGAGNAFRCAVKLDVEDAFTLIVKDFERRSVDASDDEWQVEFLARATIANPNGDRGIVRVTRASSTTVNVAIARLAGNGSTAQSLGIGSGVAWATGVKRTMKVVYNHPTVSFYLDNVLLGSLAFTADLRDGNHLYGAIRLYLATTSGVQPSFGEVSVTKASTLNPVTRVAVR